MNTVFGLGYHSFIAEFRPMRNAAYNNPSVSGQTTLPEIAPEFQLLSEISSSKALKFHI
jgi:hypothetical protein